MKKTGNRSGAIMRLAAALCLIMLLTGCASGTQSSGSAVVTEPPVTEPPADPVKTLSCIEMESMPTMVPAGDGIVAACWTSFEGSTTHIVMIDTENDTVTASRDIDGYWELSTERFTDGALALFDYNSGTWQFLDKSLNTTGEFSAEDMFGVFSHDRSKYYLLKDRVLCSVDVQTGELSRVPLPIDMRFCSIKCMYPDADTLVLEFVLSPFDSQSGFAILDLKENRYLALQEDLFQPEFTSDSIALFLYNIEKNGYDITYKAADGTFRSTTAGALGAGDDDLTSVTGSDYVLGINQNTTVYRLGTSIGSCDLTGLGIDGPAWTSCWDSSTQRLILGIYRLDKYTLYVIDPQQLTWTDAGAPEAVTSPLVVKSQLADTYWGEFSGGTVPETLQEMRSYADRLEQKYDVSILISDQCADACAYENSYAYITTTDQMGFDDEGYYIYRCLESLDRSLALYPEGFFSQMRNSMGEGGARFLLAGEMSTEIPIIGYCYEDFSGWQNMAIDVRTDELENTICHEIWHATENVVWWKISGYAFDMDEWNQFNPEGFEYYYNSTVEDPDAYKWTYFGDMGEGVYFVDSYSRQNEREDRARIMEYVMTRDDCAADLVSHPAIRGKLDIMCRAIREAFDTTGWEDLRWERFSQTALEPAA